MKRRGLKPPPLIDSSGPRLPDGPQMMNPRPQFCIFDSQMLHPWLQFRNFGSQIFDLGLPNSGMLGPNCGSSAPPSWIAGFRGGFLQNHCALTVKMVSDLGALAGSFPESRLQLAIRT